MLAPSHTKSSTSTSSPSVCLTRVGQCCGRRTTHAPTPRRGILGTLSADARGRSLSLKFQTARLRLTLGQCVDSASSCLSPDTVCLRVRR
eukprot:2740841-Rhodomonas_salina.2